MAFGGSAGPGGNVLPIGALATSDGSALTYDTDGLTLLKTLPGTVTPVRPPMIQNLRIRFIPDQGFPLDAMVAGFPAEPNVDTGALVSFAPNANQHQIPINFGPGDGNWTREDFERLRVRVIEFTGGPAAPGDTGGVHVVERSYDVGNAGPRVLIRNHAAFDLNIIEIELEYRHSIEIG